MQRTWTGAGSRVCATWVEASASNNVCCTRNLGFKEKKKNMGSLPRCACCPHHFKSKFCFKGSLFIILFYFFSCLFSVYQINGVHGKGFNFCFN